MSFGQGYCRCEVRSSRWMPRSWRIRHGPGFDRRHGHLEVGVTIGIETTWSLVFRPNGASRLLSQGPSALELIPIIEVRRPNGPAVQPHTWYSNDCGIIFTPERTALQASSRREGETLPGRWPGLNGLLARWAEKPDAKMWRYQCGVTVALVALR